MKLLPIRKIVPYKHWHLAWLEQQGKAEDGGLSFTEEQRLGLEKYASYTAIVEGDPIACSGTIEVWPGRHIAWAYLNKVSGPYMSFITRNVKKYLTKVQGRVEMTVRLDFEPGHRWAKLLGFVVETPILHHYGPQGEPHTSYVRFN